MFRCCDGIILISPDLTNDSPSVILLAAASLVKIFKCLSTLNIMLGAEPTNEAYTILTLSKSYDIVYTSELKIYFH